MKRIILSLALALSVSACSSQNQSHVAWDSMTYSTGVAMDQPGFIRMGK